MATAIGNGRQVEKAGDYKVGDQFDYYGELRQITAIRGNAISMGIPSRDEFGKVTIHSHKEFHPRDLEKMTPVSGKVVAGGRIVERSFQGFMRAVSETVSPVPGIKQKAQQTLADDYGTAWGVSKAAMGENSGVVGGYTVPTEYSTKLLRSIAEDSFIYPRAFVVPMGASETLCPYIDVETVQTAGTSPLFGGVLFKWGSSQAPAETEPTFKQMSLRAWDLLGYATVSNDWLQDTGPEGESALVNLFGKAGAWYAEYAFLRGTGSAFHMPLGILNAGATISVTRAGATAVAAADISAMMAKLLPGSFTRAIWACNPSCMLTIAKLSNYQINQWHDGGPASSCGFLGSRPLFITDKLPAVGTLGDLVLFDPGLYVIGNRMEVVVDVSPHSAFITNQTDFRVWLRLDGKPMVQGVITMPDATTTVSPYIILN